MKFKKWIAIGLVLLSTIVYAASTDYKVDNQGRVWSSDLITKSPWVDVRAYATLALANTAAYDAGKTLLITKECILTANTTLTAAVVVIKGGSFTKASTYTLTINGPFEAGLYPVFSGFDAGDVTFGTGTVKEVYPEWWGANTIPGTTDMSVEILSALDSINEGMECVLTSSNYNIGTTQIVVDRAVESIKMMPSTRVTYTGTGAAIKIDLSGGQITGLNLDLFDIYSSGTYGIQITSGGLAHAYLLLQSRIKVHTINSYTTAGIYVDASCSQNEIDVLGFYNANPPGTAWGLYFVKGEASNLFESNQIKIGCIYSIQGLYADSAFGYNYVNIDVDAGAVESLVDKIDIAGTMNIVHIRSLAPLNIYYPAGLRLRSTAIGNVILISPNALHSLTDDSPVGSNTIVGSIGLTNLIKNSSFETNSGAAVLDWTLSNLGTLAVETTEFKHGRQGIKLMPSDGYSFINQALPDDVLGKTVTFFGWFKAISTNTGTPMLTLGDDTTSNDVAIPKDSRWHFMGIRRTFTDANPYFRIWVAPAAYNVGDILYADGCVGVIGDIPTLPGNDRSAPLLFATGAGHTVDQTITILQSLGIVRQE